MRVDFAEDTRNAQLAKNTDKDYPAEIDVLNRRIYNLIEAIAENGTSQLLNSKLTELEAQKEIIEAEYRLALTSVDSAESALALTDKLIADIKNTLTDPDTNVFERQRALRMFIARIEIIPEQKALIRYFLPGSVVFDQSCGKSCGIVKVPREGLELST